MTSKSESALIHLLQRIVSHMTDPIASGETMIVLQKFEQSLHQKGEREMGNLSHDPRESELVVEDEFVERLMDRLEKFGYDTSTCDGDEDLPTIVASWFHGLISDAEANLADVTKERDELREKLEKLTALVQDSFQASLLKVTHPAQTEKQDSPAQAPEKIQEKSPSVPRETPVPDIRTRKARDFWIIVYNNSIQEFHRMFLDLAEVDKAFENQSAPAGSTTIHLREVLPNEEQSTMAQAALSTPKNKEWATAKPSPYAEEFAALTKQLSDQRAASGEVIAMLTGERDQLEKQVEVGQRMYDLLSDYSIVAPNLKTENEIRNVLARWREAQTEKQVTTAGETANIPKKDAGNLPATESQECDSKCERFMADNEKGHGETWNVGDVRCAWLIAYKAGWTARGAKGEPKWKGWRMLECGEGIIAGDQQFITTETSCRNGDWVNATGSSVGSNVSICNAWRRMA